MNKQLPSNFFSGLNELRGVAAMIVLFFHVDQFAYLFSLKSKELYVTGMAGYAVDMFFVLSGFLITYRLLIEKGERTTIAIRSFYGRRILRIWPVYYMTVALSVVLIVFKIVPYQKEAEASWPYVLLLVPNVAYVLDLLVRTLAPLWSIGVEEQFYLLWPWVVEKSQSILRSIWVVIAGFLCLKLGVYLMVSPNTSLYLFLDHTRFSVLCMGAIGAYWCFTNSRMLQFIYRKDVQIISWLVLIYSCLVTPIHVYSFIDHELNSIFYGVIVLNVATNKESLVRLENKWLNYLGKISYGLYAYHVTVLVTLSWLFVAWGYQSNYWIMYLAVVVCTVLMASLSYRFFEGYFLGLKETFSP